jgi:hypothetical protein
MILMVRNARGETETVVETVSILAHRYDGGLRVELMKPALAGEQYLIDMTNAELVQIIIEAIGGKPQAQ